MIAISLIAPNDLAAGRVTRPAAVDRRYGFEMLVNCTAYQQGRKFAEVEPHEIHDYLATPDVFVWVALYEPTEVELQTMQEAFGLHPLAVEDADHGHQSVARPKIEEYGESLFVVMNTIEFTPIDEIKLGEISVFVGENYVLSVRRRTERGFRDVRARAEREPGLLSLGSGYVLYALMDAVVDRYFPILEAIETEIELIEQRLFAAKAQPRENIESLYYAKQNLATLKHASGPLLEYSNKLFGGRVPAICAGLGEYFRDIDDHLARLNQSIEAARDTVSTAIQVNLAIVQAAESEVSKRLAAYAALCAIPTMIAGIYGMNFANMPELKWNYGYPLVMTIIAVIDGYLFYRFKKAGWV